MNIIIIGCGKVGSNLAKIMSDNGHDIVIVDRNPEHFEQLNGLGFSGFTVTGVPIDRDILLKAGIENCDALVAVTEDDNVNIMVSQMAGEIFKVPRVLARIFDPSRENVFSHFGLHTVCPTKITVSVIQAILEHNSDIQKVTFAENTAIFTTTDVPQQLINRRLSKLPQRENQVLFAVQHANGSMELAARMEDEILLADDKLVYTEIVD